LGSFRLPLVVSFLLVIGDLVARQRMAWQPATRTALAARPAVRDRGAMIRKDCPDAAVR